MMGIYNLKHRPPASRYLFYPGLQEIAINAMKFIDFFLDLCIKSGGGYAGETTADLSQIVNHTHNALYRVLRATLWYVGYPKRLKAV